MLWPSPRHALFVGRRSWKHSHCSACTIAWFFFTYLILVPVQSFRLFVHYIIRIRLADSQINHSLIGGRDNDVWRPRIKSVDADYRKTYNITRPPISLHSNLGMSRESETLLKIQIGRIKALRIWHRHVTNLYFTVNFHDQHHVVTQCTGLITLQTRRQCDSAQRSALLMTECL